MLREKDWSKTGPLGPCFASEFWESENTTNKDVCLANVFFRTEHQVSLAHLPNIRHIVGSSLENKDSRRARGMIKDDQELLLTLTELLMTRKKDCDVGNLKSIYLCPSFEDTPFSSRRTA